VGVGSGAELISPSQTNPCARLSVPPSFSELDAAMAVDQSVLPCDSREFTATATSRPKFGNRRLIAELVIEGVAMLRQIQALFANLLLTLCIASASAGQATAQSGIVGWGVQVFDTRWNSAAFVEVAAGLYHSVARRADGSVVAWGWNGDGQCNGSVVAW
jgi:hypothetical protein